MKVTQVPRLLFLILSITLSGAAAAQSISKTIIGSTGGALSADNLRLSFTVGEPVVGIMTGSGNQLGNGFFSSLDLSVLAIPEKEAELLLEIYPNPASDFFTCRQKDSHPMLIRAHDTEGKPVLDARITSGDKTAVKHWKQGLYILEITDLTTNRLHRYKIMICK